MGSWRPREVSRFEWQGDHPWNRIQSGVQFYDKDEEEAETACVGDLFLKFGLESA